MPQQSSNLPITLNFNGNDYIFADDLGHTQSLAIDNNYYYIGCNPKLVGSHYWSQDIAQYHLVNNKLVEPKKITNIQYAIKQINEKAKSANIRRVDFALSSNMQNFVIGAIDEKGTQYFLLYDFKKFTDAFSSIDVGQSISIEKTNLRPTKSFDILHFVNSKAKNPYQIGSNAFLPSVQGYSVDDHKSIYISSGLAPAKDENTNQIIHFAKIPFEKISYAYFYNEHCVTRIALELPYSYAYPQNLISENMKSYIHFFAEPETIQYCPEHNSVLLSVT